MIFHDRKLLFVLKVTRSHVAVRFPPTFMIADYFLKRKKVA